MGWEVLDTNGKLKTIAQAGPTGATGAQGSNGLQGEFPKLNKHFAWIVTSASQATTQDTGTNRLAFGCATPVSESVSGTGGGVGITTVNDARNSWRRLTIGNNASGNAGSSNYSDVGIIFATQAPYFSYRARMGSAITNMRCFIYCSSAAPTNVDTQTGTSNVVGFRYSTVAGDTGWTPFIWDGVSQTTGTTIGTVSTSTEYYFEIQWQSFTGGSISADFYVTQAGSARSTIQTLTSVITSDFSPDAGIGTRMSSGLKFFNTAAEAKTVDWAGQWMNAGYTPFEPASL